jgi:OOP family OmpA-OmpF porin
MRSRSRSQLTSVACLLGALLSSSAHAQQSGDFALNHFDPSERGSEWFVLDSLDLRGAMRPAAGLVGDWGNRPLVVYNGDDSVQSVVVRNQGTLHAGASLVLWERLRLGLNVPVQIYAEGDRGRLGGGRVVLPPESSSAMGDLRFSADFRLFGQHGEPLTAALGASLWAPTGNPKSYSGDPSVRVAPRFLVAGALSDFVYSGSLGVVYRDTNGFGDDAVGTQVALGVAAGVRLLARRLVIGPELFGSTVVASSDAALSKRATPFEGLLGAHYTIADCLRIGAGVGTGLARGYGAPRVRGVLSVEWTPGVDEPLPPPPSPELAPADRDRDGVLDASDACPDEPGSGTREPQTNGCPAPVDLDGDGVKDAEDACPTVAGVRSEDAKTLGCPASVPPVAPVAAPSPDRDGDGVPNEADACPDEAGAADADPKKSGCPRAFVQGNQIKITEQVKFGNNSGTILAEPATVATLEAVLRVLKEHPEIERLSVEGYSDNVGSAEANRKLSQRRADAVVAWLVKAGIDPKRLQSAGFGLERPIDTNDTPAGRANNRRVEFRIVGAQTGGTP